MGCEGVFDGPNSDSSDSSDQNGPNPSQTDHSDEIPVLLIYDYQKVVRECSKLCCGT